MQNTFLKKQRLISKSDFQNLRSGSRFFAFGVFVFYVKKNSLDHSRIGIAVSKKFGKAYLRNKFKRKAREYFRKNFDKLDGCFDIIIAPNFRTITKNRLQVDDVFKQFSSDLEKSFISSFKK